MKVALVTGWGSDVTEEEKEKHGVDFVLGKPVTIERLEKLVSEIVQRRQ